MDCDIIEYERRLDKPLACYSVTSLPSQSGARLCGIYVIRNCLSGNLYVGSSDHIARRFCAHVSQLRRGVHHSIRLQWAWKTRGEEAVEFLLLEEAPVEHLIEKEEAYIIALRPEYNWSVCADNPMKGRRHTPETIEKMRRNRRGKGRGKRPPRSLEHRQKMSAANTGKPGAFRGKHHTDEAKAKLSASAKERYRRAANPNSRPVEVNGIVYPTGRQAASALGVARGTLLKRLKAGMGRYVDSSDAGLPTREWGNLLFRGGSHHEARAVIVGDERFETCREAAKRFGIAESTFTYWLHRGKASYADGGAPPPMPSRHRSK